jgi:hypothetical protein
MYIKNNIYKIFEKKIIRFTSSEFINRKKDIKKGDYIAAFF